MITRDRAAEIIKEAKKKATHGPWSDQLDKVMTHAEREEIKRHWDTMDGSTNFVDALYEFVNGKVQTITCSLCKQPCNVNTAHLHQGEYIGDECCWDERLKASE